MKMKPFKVLDEHVAFEVKGRSKVIMVDLETPTGETTTWSYFSMKEAAIIVPIDTDGDTYIKQEWRLARRDFAWEFASGWIEDENVLTAANRELQEEIGFKADTLEEKSAFYTNNHMCNVFHIVVATGLHPSKLPGDEHEYLSVKKVSLKDARELLLTNQIPTAQTVIGLQIYEEYVSNMLGKTA